MRVKELLKELSKYDPEMMVVIHGFDTCGRDELGTVTPVTIKKVREESGHAPMYDDTTEEDPHKIHALLMDF